ncbi:MAG: phosphodiesterase [Lachnospiraceae bacterium]|nr:phosphodiesterase [Lachnospiraceae bacterium]
MKILFASDIHGSAYYCRKLLAAYEESKAERLVLLGDLLYHGPRNDLPQEYAPKEVIAMLNERKNEIYAVRGNCEAEVDQMVLEFPVLADYFILSEGRVNFFATHGHLFNATALPPLKQGDVLIHGHSHVLCAKKMGYYYLLNPGSVSLPKEGNPPTYAIYEDGCFAIWDFEGNKITEINLLEDKT